MQIANPIYDVVFKYLLDDNRVAKKLLSLIIEHEIVELTLCPTEIRSDMEGRTLTVYRLDFSATIVLENGEQKNVIIEIQKAKFPTDIMRFRKYLGNRYSDKNNSYSDENGRTHVLPLITIYFLGHHLPQIEAPIIKVARNYTDCISGKIIEKRDEFIESLTHDSYVIQIPRLQHNSKNRLEQVLAVFEQSDGVNHLVNINEEDYPKEYREVIRRLTKAASEPDVRSTMDVEDEILAELENLERLVAGKDQAVKAAKAAGKAEGKVGAARNCIAEGVDINLISKITGLSVSEIEKLKND